MIQISRYTRGLLVALGACFHYAKGFAIPFKSRALSCQRHSSWSPRDLLSHAKDFTSCLGHGFVPRPLDVSKNDMAYSFPRDHFDDSQSSQIIGTYALLHKYNSREPIRLFYGHPGCGKTRFLRELYLAITSSLPQYLALPDHEREAFRVKAPVLFLSIGCEDKVMQILNDTLVLPISFSGQYSISREEFKYVNNFCRTDLSKHLQLRLCFDYFNHGFGNVSFEDFVKEIYDRNIKIKPYTGDILKALAQKNHKKHVLLLVNELTKLDKYYPDDKIARMIRKLMYNTMYPLDMAAKIGFMFILFADKKMGPFEKVSGFDQRSIIAKSFFPIPGRCANEIFPYDFGNARLIRDLFLSSTSSRRTSDLFSNDNYRRYFHALSGGDPRMVEAINHVIEHWPDGHLIETASAFFNVVLSKYRELGAVDHGHISYVLSLSPEIYLTSKTKVHCGNNNCCNLDDLFSNGELMAIQEDPKGFTDQLDLKYFVPPVMLHFNNSQFKHNQELAQYTTSVDPKVFKLFLLHAENALRYARRELPNIIPPSEWFPKVDYTHMTFGELYYKKRVGTLCYQWTDTIDCFWSNEALQTSYRFDFTRELIPVEIKLARHLPTLAQVQQSPENYLDRAFFITDQRNKGFQWAYTARSDEGKYVLVCIQTSKFSVFEDDEQFQREVTAAWMRTLKSLPGGTVSHSSLATGSGSESLSPSGSGSGSGSGSSPETEWDSRNVLLVFCSNGGRSQPQDPDEDPLVINGNVIFLDNDLLTRYLGRTLTMVRNANLLVHKDKALHYVQDYKA